MNKPTHIIVHHSAVGGFAPQLRAINEHHKRKNFPFSNLGYFVGYHWVIEKDGTTIRTRKDETIGAHAVGWNDKSIGICLPGNFHKEQPTLVQLQKLRNLVKSYGLPVLGHRDAQEDRTCPGINFSVELIKDLSKPDEVDKEKAEKIRELISSYEQLIGLLRLLINKIS